MAHISIDIGTGTHEYSGRTGDVVDNEHAGADTLLDGEELKREVVLRVFNGRDPPLVDP